MIEWLENYFKKENITLFMVTHDRYFLERVCNEIVELENGRLYTYKGNYSYYLDKKEARVTAEAAEIDKAKNLFKKETLSNAHISKIFWNLIYHEKAERETC